MKNAMQSFKPSAITLAMLAGLSLPAQAQTPAAIDVDEVMVVTANRTSQNIDQVLSSVSVIDRADIDRIQPKSMSDLLELVPGLDISRQGGGGQKSSVFSRGTNSGHVLVVIDGLRIGSATLGAVDFNNISPAQIERIEVIKGPRAALWGSDAIGGVIQIFTRKLAGGELAVNLETGSDGFFGATAATGINHGDGSTTLTINSEQSDGFDAFNDATDDTLDTQPDADGHDRLSVAFNGQQQLTQEASLSWLGKLEQGSSEFDTSWGGDEMDYDNYHWQLKGDYKTGAWQHALSVGQAKEESETFGNGVAKANAALYATRRDQVNLFSQYRVSDALALALGVDYYQEKVTTDTEYAQDSRNVSAYFGQLMFERDGLLLQSALRYDDIEGLDGESTYNVSAGYHFAPDLLVSINTGQGFKAPSFNDLYYPYGGNPELEVETSDSLELLVRAKPFGIDTEFNLYQTEVTNLIEWVPNADGIWLPENVSNVDIDGAELTLAGQGFGLHHQVSLSYVDAINSKTGDRLDRRAKNNYSYQVSYDWQQLDVTLAYEYHGKRTDGKIYFFDGTIEQLYLDDYQLINLSVGYEVTPEWQLRLKANNLTDENYNTANNYNTPGAEYFLSVSYNAL